MPDAARPDDVRRNVELKASDPSPARTLEICRALGAADRGELWQRDTYFRVPAGGLARERRLVAELRRALAIMDDRLVPHGYADLLLASRAGRETSAGGG